MVYSVLFSDPDAYGGPVYYPSPGMGRRGRMPMPMPPAGGGQDLPDGKKVLTRDAVAARAQRFAPTGDVLTSGRVGAFAAARRGWAASTADAEACTAFATAPRECRPRAARDEPGCGGGAH